MAYKKVGLEYLSAFLPAGAYEWTLPYLKQYKIDLKITPERLSKLGDYMYHPQERRHKISINGTLNTYEFYFTFIHELAHLITFIQYRHSVEAHGKEWKQTFRELLKSSIDLFPPALRKVITIHLAQLKSAQCYDKKLFLEFKKFDDVKRIFVTDLKPGDVFSVKSGEQYQVIAKRRTRFLCENVESKKQYLFPSLYEVSTIISGSVS